jgi:hypothetical protein
VSRRPLFHAGLAVSCATLVAATLYLISVGAAMDTVEAPLTPAETLWGGGGLILGAMGAAVFLGLLLRPEAPIVAVPAGTEMPPD